MRVCVVCVGKLKERFWREACAEYAKRLGAYVRLELVEVADRDPSKCGGAAAAREAEAADILKACRAGSHVVALCIGGCERSSEGLANHLDQLALSGTSDFTFVIGGSTGLAPSVLERANEQLSFGPITLPHNLARVVLLEQIYRAQKISHGEPYHK